MSQRRGLEARFWLSVACRYLVILFVGWVVILWFQGCIVPAARDELRLQQQTAHPESLPK